MSTETETRERFSKQSMRRLIERRIDSIQFRAKESIGKELDWGKGSAQVKGRGEEASLLYGEFSSLVDLLGEIQT